MLQLVWGLGADTNLKAWTCGILLSHMAAAAGRMKVLHFRMICTSCLQLSLHLQPARETLAWEMILHFGCA